MHPPLLHSIYFAYYETHAKSFFLSFFELKQKTQLTPKAHPNPETHAKSFCYHFFNSNKKPNSPRQKLTQIQKPTPKAFVIIFFNSNKKPNSPRQKLTQIQNEHSLFEISSWALILQRQKLSSASYSD
ncbi:hypothetical protein AB3S75_034984 [Citrus x aurantiifolia]